MRSSVPNGRDDSVYMMYYFFLRALLFTLLNVVTVATSTVKPLAGNDNAKNAQCTNVNNYFYAGPNTRKIEQQLAELKEEIKALKRPGNDAGSSRGKGLKTSFRVYFHLVSSCWGCLRIEVIQAIFIHASCQRYTVTSLKDPKPQIIEHLTLTKKAEWDALNYSDRGGLHLGLQPRWITSLLVVLKTKQLAGGMKPIINGEKFWVNNNTS